MGNRYENTKDIARAALSAAICCFVGKGKPYSRKGAAAAIGCTVATVENLINCQTACDHAQLMRMVQVFGVRFLNLYLAPFGLGNVQMTATAKQCERVLNSSMARANAAITEALADGHIDHQERAQMMPLLMDAAETTSRYIAAHKRQTKGARRHV